MNEHPEAVRRYLARLYDEANRAHAFGNRSSAEFAAWQASARAAFLALLGLPRIARDAAGHRVTADVPSGGEDMGGYIRSKGHVATEPAVRMPFWILRPKGQGPFPLAVTPHGHENGDTYAGIWHDDRSREQVTREDQDVAVQAVKRGFLTLVPATRGIASNPASFRIADVAKRHDGRDCRCHNWQTIVAGRTLLGERVWDLMRLLDWALALPEVRPQTVLLMGNSGGGMATLHTAAADERVAMAVACCSYNNYVSPGGVLRHCPCNAIPGIMNFGEYWDVAGLAAPRRLLTVNGRKDPAHPTAEVDLAVSRLKRIYQASGHPERYEHRYGVGGHRFFADLMWPWVEEALRELAASPGGGTPAPAAG